MNSLKIYLQDRLFGGISDLKIYLQDRLFGGISDLKIYLQDLLFGGISDLKIYLQDRSFGGISDLKIYLQDLLFGGISDLKKFLSLSDFHIGCIVDSYISQQRSAEEVVDADIFDVFGEQNKDKCNNRVTGSMIVVDKQLSAYVRREWMTEREECVWVTVPSQGALSRLHVACVNFPSSSNLDFFTQTLTSLSKTHANDTFLVVGCFPLNWFSEEHQLIAAPRSNYKDDANRLYSSVLHAGLAQFNNTMNEDSTNCTAVFSSVPVTVTPCPYPFYQGQESWKMGLKFSLNIDSSECCKTATDATGPNFANEPSGKHEAHREGVNASGDSSTIIDRLVNKKWEDLTQLLPELISEKFQQTAKELKTVQEECGRMSKEKESAKSACKRIEKMEARLRTLEERALTHRERSTSERSREASDESPGMSGDSDRTTNQGDSNNEALTEIKMAVIADNHPASTLGADMLNPVRGFLWGMLDTAPDPLPKVSWGEMISGVLHFTCEGADAVKWLCRLNGVTVGDAKLTVVSTKDLPKPVTMAWRSRITWCVDTPKVLNILQRYNPSLRTAEWKVDDPLVEEGHVSRIVYMDRVSADIIKMNNYSLYAGLDSSAFKLLEDSEGKVEGPTGQKAAKVTPIADPQDPEGSQRNGDEETATEQNTSPTSTVSTDELLGGPDVMGLTLSPQPEETTIKEGAGGNH